MVNRQECLSVREISYHLVWFPQVSPEVCHVSVDVIVCGYLELRGEKRDCEGAAERVSSCIFNTERDGREGTLRTSRCCKKQEAGQPSSNQSERASLTDVLPIPTVARASSCRTSPIRHFVCRQGHEIDDQGRVNSPMWRSGGKSMDHGWWRRATWRGGRGEAQSITSHRPSLKVSILQSTQDPLNQYHHN